ncbi:MAG: hypothetical protein KY476_22945 [Planctomycetes bacterium]|nr:hypothetical protein [Planctomycetota bacterium]
MFFRFACGLCLAVLVAVGDVALETRCLKLRRSMTRQHYRLEVLRESAVRLRLETQALASPARVRLRLAESEARSLRGDARPQPR